MIRVVLADDHGAIRDGLCALFAAEPDIEVVGVATDGISATELIERLEPDIVILDLMMPGLNGLEITRALSLWYPEMRFIVLSMYHDEAYVREALRNGAAAYCLKQNCVEEVVEAVKCVAAGRRFLGATIPRSLVEHYSEALRPAV